MPDPEPRQRVHVVVDHPDDVGERADVVLGRRVEGVSRRVARAMALEGRLWIDDERAPPSTRVQQGARLELRWPAQDARTRTAPAILRVTDDFVYVDKPADVHTHRHRPDDPESLADGVAREHPECASASADPREGGVVHRLDRPTTGVVAFARSRDAWLAARDALSHGRCDKVYLAACTGGTAWPPTPGTDGSRRDLRPAPGAAAGAGLPVVGAHEPYVITAPLGHGRGRSRVGVRADGEPATTVVWPVAIGNDHALYGLRLGTGRRHQARVHLAWIGRPVLGDDLYGSGPPPETLMLHAFAFDLSAALATEPRVEAPPPRDFLAGVRAHGIDWPGSGHA